MKSKFKVNRIVTSETQLPAYWLLSLFLSYVLVAYLAFLIDNALPYPVSEEHVKEGELSEKRAWTHLRDIVGSGPRVAGSKYHLEKTYDMQARLISIAQNATQKVKIDWQRTSGDYWLGYQRPYVNHYHDVSNLIALIVGESGLNANGTTNSSILVNCHYDTVPTSPGASDNSIFCAVMMETLDIMSKKNVTPKHNVIFLFNGAEENPLQGSHAFLQHPWSKGANAVINLDSTGMNGKSIIFQVTDPRVLDAYMGTVSMPNAQSLGEAIFLSGLVPSDTDFRIFRDFASIHGIDIAFSKFGHVYHTRFDCLEIVKPGVLQHAGNMILAVTDNLANTEAFSQKVAPKPWVYWDYLNMFMFSYSPETGFLLDTLALLVGIASVCSYFIIVGFRRSKGREFAWCIVGRILASASGFALPIILSLMSSYTTIHLRYLSRPLIVVVTVWIPFLIASIATSHLFDAWRSQKCGLNRERRVAQAMAAKRSILCFAVFLLLFVKVAATARYLLTVPLLLMSLAAFISLSVLRYRQLCGLSQLALHFGLSLPSVMFLFVLLFKINGLMLPVMGRSTTARPDLVIAILNAGVAVLVCMTVSGMELLFSKRHMWKILAVPLFICFVLNFVPFHPYSGNIASPAPQRHYWLHSQITSFNSTGSNIATTSGIWMLKIDANFPGTVLKAAQEKQIDLGSVKTNFSDDCNKSLYCGLPMITPRTLENVPGSIWIDFPPPTMEPPNVEFILNNRSCIRNTCTLSFTMAGPPHRSIIIWPRYGVNVTSCSLSIDKMQVSMYREFRPVYFIYYTDGTYKEGNGTTGSFTIDFEISAGLNVATEPIANISYCVHKTHHREDLSPEFSDLVDAMPDWFNIVPIISSRYNYIF